MQEIKIWPYEQMVDAQPRIILENETQKPLWDFEKQTEPLLPTRRPDLVIIHKTKKKKKKKKKNCRIADFSVPADHSKIKRKKKIPGPSKGIKNNCRT